MKTIGLALGGGGVRGLAHVLVLEALDEMGCKPSVISGTSMGAVVGALYASGLSGKAIRERVFEHIISKDETWKDVLKKRSHLLKWAKSFALELGGGGILKTDRFLSFLLDAIRPLTFEELGIPLIVIATDFWRGEEVAFEKGKLLPAIQASMAVPGVFAPVSIAGRVLVDGGVVNLVPYDRIVDRCDVSIAVNVAKARSPDSSRIPGVLESILGAFDIMQTATLAEKAKRRQPDIWIRPIIRDVAMFDFGKAEDVFRQAEPAIAEMRAAVAGKIGRLPKPGRGLLKTGRFPWSRKK